MLSKIYQIFFKSKNLKVKNLKSKKIMILDKKVMDQIRFKNSITICTRYTETYKIILLKTIFKKYLYFLKEDILTIYLEELIKITKPKYIVSFNDYNLSFYRLKNNFKNIKFIFFACTFRSNATLIDILSKINEKLKIDYMCVWGKNTIKYYNKFLVSNFIVSGSYRNNLYKIKLKKDYFKNNNFVFISQFRLSKDWQKKNYDYYKKLLLVIHDYCKQKKRKLYIIGSKKDSVEKKSEINWYKYLLKGRNYYFLNKDNSKFFSYNASDKFTNFITFSSSLGFELASRNNKVVFFNKPKHTPKKFVYIESFFIKKTGPFWTNKYNKKEIFRLMDYLVNADYKKTINNRKKYIDPYLIYDYQNQNLRKKLKKENINIF